MDERERTFFAHECERYLMTLGINTLRAYGRRLGLQAPTKRKKGDLIRDIVEALCGEEKPSRSKRGAPIKNDYIEPSVLEEIEKIKGRYFDGGMSALKEEKESEEGVFLQFTVQPSKLNERQKQRLHDFLSCL